MAGIDLYGGDASQIRNAYRSSLGRDASDDEVSNWLTGTYGYNNLNERLSAISGSGEAQAYKQSQGPPPPDGTVIGQPSPDVNTTMPVANNDQQVAQWYQEFLGRQGGQDEISNWLSGTYGWGNNQNLSGIREGIYGSPEAVARRTSLPPAPTGSTPPGPQQGIPNNDPYAWFMSIVNGKTPTPETLESLAPMLNQYGIKIGSKGDRGWSDTIILPDGRTYDVIEAAGKGTGKAWTWQQNGGAGYVPPQAPPTQFSDPYTKFLEQLLGGRIGSLMQPVQDPNRAMYDAMLKQRADTLGRLSPELDKQIAYLEQRFNELQGSGYTGAEGEVIRTGALDPIEQDRTMARKRLAERLAARGMNPDSGVFQAAMADLDKSFDSMRATTQTALTTNDLNRREDRKGRAEGIRSTLSQIPEGRAREQLDVYSAINQLSLLARQEDEARQREAIGYGGALADLGPQRLQLAMQAAGMGGNPSSMFSNLMQLAGMNQNASMFNAQNQQGLWSGLGSLAAMLSGAGR